MSGEQKYNGGGRPLVQWEASNRDELLVFTDRQQCYKAFAHAFDDSKASVLGDYLPAKLEMEEGETDPAGPAWPGTIPGSSCSSLPTVRWPGYPWPATRR